MTIGDALTEPLINGELNPPPLTASVLVVADNYGAAPPRRLSDGRAGNPAGHDPSPRWVWAEVREQGWLAGPIMAMYMLQYVMMLSGIIFVGRLGAFPLAAVSLANSFSGMTGFTILMGLASALETLCGQAYGAKQYHLLGIYLQRAVIILASAAAPVAVLWLNMRRILVAVGEDPAIAAAAQAYIVWLAPCLLAYSVLLPLIKFFQTQRAVFPLMLCSAVTVSVHVPLCWLVIDQLGVGYKGAAITADFSLLLNVGLLCAVVRFSPRFAKTFAAFSCEALQDFGGFFRLAIPSATMMCLEYWSFEVLTLLAGLLPNSKLNIASFAICMGLLSLANMISTALSVAASVRVSNELGAGKTGAARAAVAVSLGLGLVEGTAMAGLILCLRSVWGWAFSNEREVVEHVAGTAPYLAVLAVLYSCQAILSGVVRGIGWQRVGAFANLGAYYGVGLPVAVISTFVFHFDSRGLWLGMGCGLATQTVALVTVILCTNWDKLAKEALLRSNSYSSRLPTTAPFLIKPQKEDCDSNDLQQTSSAVA